MTQILPTQEQPQAVSATVTTEKPQNFPSISRFITEWHISEKSIFYTKVFAASFFSGIFLVSIVLQAINLSQNLELIQNMKQERGRVSQEITYWKGVSQQYHGYRDVYFRIAALEYKIGNIYESKKYMEKALELDPQFEAGRVLGEKIKVK